MKYKSLSWILRNQDLKDSDSLHLAAIANLKDNERILERWWCKKYKKPLKDFADHVYEELFVEMLEDYYEANPAEIEKFITSRNDQVASEWHGETSDEYESQIKGRLEKINKRLGVDISKYQDDEELTPEQEQEILDNLGKDLPKNNIKPNKGEVVLGKEEFDEEF